MSKRCAALSIVTILGLNPLCSMAQSNDPALPIAEKKAGILNSDTQSEGIFARFYVRTSSSSILDLLEQHIPVLATGAEPQIPTASFLRKLQREIGEILATEGYFSPRLQFDKNQEGTRVDIQIEPGSRTQIKNVLIHFTGALQDAAEAGDPSAIARRAKLIADWNLLPGAWFRQDDWSNAKTMLMENLRSFRYAGAVLVDSRASIDPDSALANLELDVDSGAAFLIGDLSVIGLERYPLWLIDRFNPPKKGEPYSSHRLTEFQRGLQNSAYFSTVAFNIETDSTKADALPIELNLTERQTRDLSFGTGYSSSTGFRTEVSYRDRNLLNRVWDLHSALRIEQKRQLAYADVNLPPNDNNRLDSFGLLFDRSNLEGLLQTKSMLGIKRTITHGLVEQRLGLNYTQEKVVQKSTTNLETERRSRALVASAGWTWRNVDDVFAPRQGQRAQVDMAVSDKAIVSDQRFVRLYGKYQYWYPLGQRDNFLVRMELGKVFSSSANGIPEDYLFRTGGSTSVRGYAYQSLGVRQGEAVVGGRVMAASSLEYVHWRSENLGFAAFFDAGSAATNWSTLKLQQGIGVGTRIKTPAGPIALDLSYGRQIKKFRLDFSIAIAF
ncbi:autotransporter assembly complex protein TamA [Undibacterium fentianense]|uniref:BamA/TamA family outer membrane protein n=1 Tax=Undibacterium fentianense TaxID=2828728 RepID=A0A941E5P5_9BURK|nr:BamA/TamA family outer membrane protein [Undibacterium fentianense]MBR7801089.1 BamA/TamA family outer membrane protein [Undibacterium fentianense]